MSIKGLSEKTMLPRLGKIRIGIKAVSEKNQKEYPKAVDYFVFPEEYLADVKEAYGTDKPKVIDIVLVSNDIEQVAPDWYKAHAFRGLMCKGDGEKARRLIDLDAFAKTGDLAIAEHDAGNVGWKEITCPGTNCPYYQNRACNQVKNFQFMLPDIPGIGVWQLDTGSYHSIIQINSALDLLRRINGGRMSGVPLKLVIQPKEVLVQNHTKTIFTLNIELPRITPRQLMENAKNNIDVLIPPPDEDEAPELDEAKTDKGQVIPATTDPKKPVPALGDGFGSNQFWEKVYMCRIKDGLNSRKPNSRDIDKILGMPAASYANTVGNSWRGAFTKVSQYIEAGGGTVVTAI